MAENKCSLPHTPPFFSLPHNHNPLTPIHTSTFYLTLLLTLLKLVALLNFCYSSPSSIFYFTIFLSVFLYYYLILSLTLSLTLLLILVSLFLSPTLFAHSLLLFLLISEFISFSLLNFRKFCVYISISRSLLCILLY